jgi:hypothetical protein
MVKRSGFPTFLIETSLVAARLWCCRSLDTRGAGREPGALFTCFGLLLRFTLQLFTKVLDYGGPSTLAIGGRASPLENLRFHLPRRAETGYYSLHQQPSFPGRPLSRRKVSYGGPSIYRRQVPH